jgi:hypothetical protein
MRWFLFAILLACKGDQAPTKGTGSAEPPVAPKVGVPERPVLPDAGTPRPELPGQQPTGDSKFEAETRDGDWAEETENTIQKRFEKVRGGKLEAAECRQSQCKLTISGSEGDVAKTIADLEGPRGLHGFAKNILLTAPSKKPDGTIELRAYAIFDR